MEETINVTSFLYGMALGQFIGAAVVVLVMKYGR